MEIAERMGAQQAFFQTGATRDIHFRQKALRTLGSAITHHESALLEALRADLGKSPFEGYMAEVSILRHAVRETLASLPRWTRTRRVHTPLSSAFGASHVLRDPYGLVAIFSPWNYPLQLSVLPLIGALAAGNCAVIKTSKDAPYTAEAVEHLLRDCFEPSYVSCFTGNRQVNQEILHGPCDLIFFTGSPAVGREVMRAAADRLTPVVLELGGKSPCIVLADADIELAARRILWGKLLNAGQTCVAPDYVLVDQAVEEPLLRALARQAKAMFGETPLANPELPRIVNASHFQRLMGYMGGGHAVIGGQGDASSLRIAPTVLTDVAPDAALLQEEIFGPILPVLPFADWADAMVQVAKHPNPLACYLFSKNARAARARLSTIPFGSGCVNDCVLQLANSRLPFGGVAGSGMGCYHGKYSIDCFSRPKGILTASRLVDPSLRYAPYEGKLAALRRLMR